MTPPDAPRHSSPYQRFCHAILLPAADLVLGHRVQATFRDLQRFQWATADEIARYRAGRLQHLVAFSASHVPFYRNALRHRGLTAADVREPGDLPLLPVLTKSHLRDQHRDLQVEGYTGARFEMKSSGSTGTQTTVLVDQACNDEVFATQLLFWSWGGFAMGLPHLQTGMSIERGVVRRAKDLMFRCTYRSAFNLSDTAVQSMIADIDRRGIRALFGYASSLYVLARYLEERDLTRPMACIFTWGDSLFPRYRAAIEKVFRCRVNDCYGLGEGLQCAAQCEQHDALHEAMHGVILEIVDGAGSPVPPGVLGRVIATRLTPGPMPLIRYDTGDVASFIEGPCPCGRALRRVSRIQGRATDIVSTPAGDRLIVHVFTQIFEMIPEIAQFQVRQESPAAITILYVRGRAFVPAVLERARDQIAASCRYPLQIDFTEVDVIPLERSNKRRFVVSTVPF